MTAPLVEVPFGPNADRRSLLDRAHRGDIEGAFGVVREFDTGPRLTFGRRLGTLVAIMGPGLLVLAADNDAGTFSVFAQAGQNYGLNLLWPLLLLAPVLFVNQEMVARLGAVTGAGHARLIFERFGRRWGAFALTDLLILNLLTLVTEFIGVALALGYFGVSRYFSVPLAALAIVAMTSTGRFRRWERMMYVLVAVNFTAIPLMLLSHPNAGAVARAFMPGISRSPSAGGVLFVLALVGTTVSPFQFFFQQSNVVDKRITARWLSYERIDTMIGAVVFVAVAAAVVLCCAFAFDGTHFHGAFANAGSVASGLSSRLGPAAGVLFAIVLLNASLLGAGIVTLSTSYAIGDVTGVKHSLHRRWRDAPVFHGSFAISVALAAGVALVPHAPLGLLTIAVQALAAVLLPSAAIFLLLLCNDEAVLGPWTNPRWLNILATSLVGLLLVLSGLLIVTTILPQIDVRSVTISLAGLFMVALVLIVVANLRSARKPVFGGTPSERLRWTMPRLERVAPPSFSRGRTAGLIVLRVYLLLATVLLVAKIVLLA